MPDSNRNIAEVQINFYKIKRGNVTITLPLAILISGILSQNFFYFIGSFLELNR